MENNYEVVKIYESVLHGRYSKVVARFVHADEAVEYAQNRNEANDYFYFVVRRLNNV